MLAMAFLTMNRCSQALAHFQKVAKIDKQYKSNMFLLMAIAHKKKGDVGMALMAISQQLALCQDLEALFYRARIFLTEKKYEKAIEDINKILMKNSHHAAALLLKIKILTLSKNYNSALQCIRFAKEMVEEIDKQQEIRLEEAQILSLLHKFPQALVCL